jgi:NTE family protein
MKIFKLVDFTLSKQGLVKGDKMINKLKEFISDADIENLNIYYAAVAADIINKKEVVFTKGSVYDAIRASIAFPPVLTPVKTENGLLVDGGVINNIPISHAKRIPNDILIVVNVNADVPLKNPNNSKKGKVTKQSLYRKKINDFYQQLRKNNPPAQEAKLGYFDVINRTLGLMTYRITQMTLENYCPDILINISRESCNMYDFFKAEEMVEIGRNAAIEGLRDFK